MLDHHTKELLNGLNQSISHTTEVAIGNRTYVALSGRLSDVETIVIMRDITNLKEWESDVETSTHALAHELITPLNIINGFSKLLQESAQLDEKGQVAVAHIISAAHSIWEVIQPSSSWWRR